MNLIDLKIKNLENKEIIRLFFSLFSLLFFLFFFFFSFSSSFLLRKWVRKRPDNQPRRRKSNVLRFYEIQNYFLTENQIFRLKTNFWNFFLWRVSAAKKSFKNLFSIWKFDFRSKNNFEFRKIARFWAVFFTLRHVLPCDILTRLPCIYKYLIIYIDLWFDNCYGSICSLINTWYISTNCQINIYTL